MNRKPSLIGDSKTALNAIGGQYAFSWPVAAISFIWATYISVGFDGTRFGTSAFGWFLSSLVAHTLLILIAIPIRLKLLPVEPRQSKPALTIFIFACFGLIRSIIIGQLAVSLRLAPTHEWGNRQIAGVITVTTGLAATTILVTAIAQRRDALKSLTLERNQLISLQQNSEGLFNERIEEVHSIINESIKPSLDEINLTLTSNNEFSTEATNQTTKLITSLIDERLRPLSDELHELETLKTLEKLKSFPRKPLVKLRTKVNLEKLITPLLIFFIMTSISVSGSIYYAGIAGIPIAILINIPFLVLLTLVRRLIPDTWELNAWLALPISAVLNFGAAFPGLYLVKIFDTYYPGLGRQFLIGLIGFTGSAILIALMRTVESERLAFEQDFKQVNNEASVLLSSLNQRIWLAQKNAAQLLHGSVQASLTAANLRLRQDNLTSDVLQKVREDITRAIASVTNVDRTDLDFEGSLEELIDLWDGVCNIDIAASPDVVQIMNQNVATAYCANEFIKECVNNAIKHGAATQIDIQIQQGLIEGTPVGDIEIEVVNNGQDFKASQAGLGTRILDEITIDWNRSTAEGGTRVWGRIALAPNLLT